MYRLLYTVHNIKGWIKLPCLISMSLAMLGVLKIRVLIFNSVKFLVLTLFLYFETIGK